MSPAPSLAVRPATPADLATLVAGNQAMALETEGLALDPAVLERGVGRGLRGEVDARYWLAQVDGEVAGQLMVTREWSDWRDGQVWWIQSVYVWPRWRRAGIYRAMHQQVLDEARAAGARGLRLYVDARNARAQETYRAVGMDGEHYRVFEQMLVELPLHEGPDR